MCNMAYITITIICLLTIAGAVLWWNDTAYMTSFLRVSPLQYKEQLELGAEKVGYVDVSNPDDFEVTITTEVQAFRQINSEGDLEFYDDEHVQKGINVDVDTFELGPREAARVFFEIDTNRLPEGGVYAALLFRSSKGDLNSGTSHISTTTRAGPLLILENGDGGVREGGISQLDMPWWQFGSGISGRVAFKASEDSQKALAFEPQLGTDIPLAGDEAMSSGLVFPGNTREFTLERDGHYLGIFPVSVTDSVTGDNQRQWILAVTGVWQIILPAFLAAIAASIGLQRYFKQ